MRFLPFSPKAVFFLPQKTFVTDGTLRQQVTVFYSCILTDTETTVDTYVKKRLCPSPRLSAGKHAIGNGCGKTSNRCRARESMKQVPIAGRHATYVERRKTCNRCRARLNMQAVQSSWAKHAIDAELGKTCNRCRALLNMQLVQSSSAKHAIGAEREKTCNRCRARLNMQAVQSSSAKHATDGEREKTCNRSLSRKCAHQRRQRRCKFSSR